MAHVAAIKREGISSSDYAKQHALAAKSLYRWPRRVNATATVTASPSHGVAFVALRVADPVVGQPLTGCTLMLGSSLRLEMATLPAPDWLASLAHAAHETAVKVAVAAAVKAAADRPTPPCEGRKNMSSA